MMSHSPHNGHGPRGGVEVLNKSPKVQNAGHIPYCLPAVQPGVRIHAWNIIFCFGLHVKLSFPSTLPEVQFDGLVALGLVNSEGSSAMRVGMIYIDPASLPDRRTFAVLLVYCCTSEFPSHIGGSVRISQNVLLGRAVLAPTKSSNHSTLKPEI